MEVRGKLWGGKGVGQVNKICLADHARVLQRLIRRTTKGKRYNSPRTKKPKKKLIRKKVINLGSRIPILEKSIVL